MADRSRKTLILFLLTLFIFLTVSVAGQVTKTPSRRQHHRKTHREKTSHLHFYFHDIASGQNATSIQITGPHNNITYLTGFGDMMMIDNPLTEELDLNSKLIGRAQGLYASADQKDVSLVMAMSFVFVYGKYNGSSLSILGRNSAMQAVREMAVVGGSGLFRFARGYALLKTKMLNFDTGDATVEYDVYVRH